MGVSPSQEALYRPEAVAAGEVLAAAGLRRDDVDDGHSIAVYDRRAVLLLVAARHVDSDVDAGVPALRVQPARDAPGVTPDSRRWTDTLPLAITIVAAEAGIKTKL